MKISPFFKRFKDKIVEISAGLGMLLCCSQKYLKNANPLLAYDFRLNNLLDTLLDKIIKADVTISLDQTKKNTSNISTQIIN